ncbi:cell division/cell wall cluster transcriptional repressor MraZ [Roseicyclus persicicus]|uniref:Transcriptional regulator MraZ n=1 Tax=Roseicyclus persicicus TaxID=2650661 RepID=A0A7X6JYJ1_9RHOB|nr:cell division/cell wall cluster transcriptional repressor MraZ [Roseibacterium persicicum]
MEREFTGVSRNKVDGKGRVSIPVKFRRVLQNCDADYTPDSPIRLHITFGDPSKRFLECWSADAYARLLARISAMKSGSAQKRIMSYYYKTMSETVTLDDTGRLVLSQELRDKIALDEEAAFEGHGEKFHILSPAEADQQAAAFAALLAELGQGDEHFDALSLLPDDPAPAGAE